MPRYRALGYVILHIDHSMTGHDLAITQFSQYWNRCTRSGHGYDEIADRFSGTDEPFGAAECRAERNRVFTLALLCATCAAATLILRSWIPVVCSAVALGVLAVGTAWKARWKNSDPITFRLYGVHSHLQQLPVYVGQLHSLWDRNRGRQGGLAEYKKPESGAVRRQS